MYIKIKTVKVKRKKYRYVVVVSSDNRGYRWTYKAKEIANLGRLEDVKHHTETLINGLRKLSSS